MKKTICIIFSAAIFINANAQKNKKLKADEKLILKNETDSFSYALGMSIGESLKMSGANNVNITAFNTAMDEIFKDRKTIMSKEQANLTLQQKLQEFNQKKREAQINEGKNFLSINSKRPSVTTLPNGLQYEILIDANKDNPKPKITDTVKVNYAGFLTNGTEFENSVKIGKPLTIPLNGVIKGWQQALQLMPKGATWKIYIPSELAYGENPPNYNIPPNAVLVFELALLDIKPAFIPEK